MASPGRVIGGILKNIRKMEVKLETTERQVAHFREQLSRIIRQVKLIERGKTTTKAGKNRLDIITDCAIDIDEHCKTLRHLEGFSESEMVKMASKYSSERRDADTEQDNECMYDYYQGLRAMQRFLLEKITTSELINHSDKPERRLIF